MRRILIVDDDGGVREVLKNILEDIGHYVDTVSTISAARQFLQSHPETDIIFVDNDIPEGSQKNENIGLEFLGELKLRFPDVDPVFMSGRLHQETIAERARLLTSFAMAKPFPIDEPINIVKHLVRQRQHR